ncbi:hypothetical protein EDD21DRAFT_421173 [Dissophora ornata]|nr:hypothetical protein EDD21DRAFT_421173 [Dissophora ornata]
MANAPTISSSAGDSFDAKYRISLTTASRPLITGEFDVEWQELYHSKASLIDVLNAASSRIECELFMANYTKDAEGKKAQVDRTEKALRESSMALLLSRLDPAGIIAVYSIRNKTRRTQQEFVVVTVGHSYFCTCLLL